MNTWLLLRISADIVKMNNNSILYKDEMIAENMKII